MRSILKGILAMGASYAPSKHYTCSKARLNFLSCLCVLFVWEEIVTIISQIFFSRQMGNAPKQLLKGTVYYQQWLKQKKKKSNFPIKPCAEGIHTIHCPVTGPHPCPCIAPHKP